MSGCPAVLTLEDGSVLGCSYESEEHEEPHEPDPSVWANIRDSWSGA